MWKLVGTVGKHSSAMLCFHIPAKSAFWYSSTAEMHKGNTFYFFWLQTAAAIWRMGLTFPVLLHVKWPGVPSLACLVHCQKEELLTLCRVHSLWPRGVWYLPFNHHDAIYLPVFSGQTEKEDFFMLYIFFLSSAQEITANTGTWATAVWGLDTSLQQTG